MVLPAICWILAACSPPTSGSKPNSPSTGKTIGFVLSGFDYLFYNSKDGKEECPDGLVYTSKQNWLAQFPTRAARKEHFDRCGGMDNRGPNCENVLINPESAHDPLPFREVRGSKSYGVNLDGTEDGRAGATTCAHEKFVHPDGTKGIDNQFYRLLGCVTVFHSGTFGPLGLKSTFKTMLSNSRGYRLVLEIRGVDNELNDDDVDVAIYYGKDPLAVDANGDALPWQSQRVNDDLRPQHLRGRIVNGELITEPADVVTPLTYLEFRPALVRGFRLRLRLSKTGAEGISSGYVDAASWWRLRRTGLQLGGLAGDSPPSLYSALNRLADGYKDPSTGACTALSSARGLQFVRAYVLHANKDGGVQ